MEQIVPACRTGQCTVRKGRTGVLIGVPSTTVELSARDIQTFIEWYEQGDLDLDALVTARYSLDQINEAVHALENGEIAGGAILEL
jgi:Zn-dependent alcohol dehydrogenase